MFQTSEDVYPFDGSRADHIHGDFRWLARVIGRSHRLTVCCYFKQDALSGCSVTSTGFQGFPQSFSRQLCRVDAGQSAVDTKRTASRWRSTGASLMVVAASGESDLVTFSLMPPEETTQTLPIRNRPRRAVPVRGRAS